MPLIYSSVSRGTTTLAEYAAFTGNFGTVAKTYLDKVGATEGKKVYTIDKHNFMFYTKEGVICLAVSEETFSRDILGGFVEKLFNEFSSRVPDRGASVAATGKEGGLNSTFGKQIKQLMEHAQQFPEEYSKTASVQKKVDEVKNIMTENIEKVLVRGEKLDNLQGKTEDLLFEADRFVRTGRTLRRRMWWQNCKMKLVIIFAVILLAVIIFLLVCFSGGNCLK